jgi:hypothetical protein
MKHIRVAALLGACLALVPLARAADEPGESVVDRDASAGRVWKEKLGLSDEQIPKFLAAVRTRDAGMLPLREELRAGMRRLSAQLAESAPEKDVQDTLQRLVRVRRTISFRNDQFETGLASFLAPSQRAKLFVWKSLGAFRGKAAPGLEADDFQDASSAEEVEPE